MKTRIPVDERGNPLGEFHHNSKLSDSDIELIRKLHEEGLVGYRSLALTFGCSRSTIRDIVLFKRRASTPAKWVERKSKT